MRYDRVVAFGLTAFSTFEVTKAAPQASAPLISPDYTCGKTGGGLVNGVGTGYTCADSQCCSQSGYCGNATAYCGDGCQAAYGRCGTSAPTGTPGTTVPVVDTDQGNTDTDAGADSYCGPTNKNASCGKGQCCSSAGYCGTGREYCAAPDCQFNFGPGCDANITPGGKNTSTFSRAKLGAVAVGGAGLFNCEKPGTVALTYDDGPSVYTSDILDLLDKYNAQATFFITGNNNGKGRIDDASKPWPAIIKRMYAQGHQLASHSWSHADLSAITASQRRNEMWNNEIALNNIVGVIPTYMRPPYSSCTGPCQADMSALGYHITNFDLDTQDYLHTTADLAQVPKDIFDQYFVGKNPESDDALVIAHDIHYQTVYNLTEHMLKTIQKNGYTAVTVGDCLGDPISNWYRTENGVPVSSAIGAARTSVPVSSKQTAASTNASTMTATNTALVSSKAAVASSPAASSAKASTMTATNTALVSSNAAVASRPAASSVKASTMTATNTAFVSSKAAVASSAAASSVKASTMMATNTAFVASKAAVAPSPDAESTPTTNAVPVPTTATVKSQVKVTTTAPAQKPAPTVDNLDPFQRWLCIVGWRFRGC